MSNTSPQQDTPYVDDVRQILTSVLGLGARGDQLTPDTPLLGSMPELDSMAAVSLIAALEEHFGFTVDDDEVVADAFRTVGSVAEFVRQKLER